MGHLSVLYQLEIQKFILIRIGVFGSVGLEILFVFFELT